MDLRPGQVLLLEIDEDHAVVSDTRADNTQIKFSDGAAGPRAISLRSPGVVQAILRYWAQSQAGADPKTHLRFLTNSSAAREQSASMPDGKCGLTYWTEAARGSDLQPLRTLLGELFQDTDLGRWLESNPSDDEIRSRLIKRIEFVLGAPDDVALQGHIRERLGMLYLGKGHYETTADTALPVLLDKVFLAASTKSIDQRRLTVGDLHQAIEELIPRMGALVLAPSQPEIGVGVTPLQLRSGLSGRSTTVAEILKRTGQGGVIWLHGPNGVGKSTLAKLIANSSGGSWLVCDFRPFQADVDSRGAVAVWRELMSALSRGAPPDGIILDDISARGMDLLKSRLAGLTAATKIRGAKIVVTSNHTPSPALLAEIGAQEQSAQYSPYFSISDVSELIAQSPAPKAELVDGWSNLIHVSTSGGHPLLVTAKIANLRARGWPDEALLEDLGLQVNEGIEGTKIEARKRLLAELPANTSARAVLERISTVFQNFDDGLVQALCRDPPPVDRPLDALVLLKGTWLEPVATGGWRLSPLLSDLARDVPEQTAKKWRRIAAEYWLTQSTLNARTLPLCFWNAYLGRHPFVLLKVTQAIMTLEAGQVQSAAALLSPLAAFRTDRSIFPEEPMTASSLRLLQIIVANAIEDETAAVAAAEALVGEIDALSLPEFRELQTSLAAKVVLDLDRVWIPARIQVTYLRKLKATIDRVMGGSFPALKASMDALAAGLPKGASACGVHLAGVFMRMRDSERFSELIDALAEMEEEERTPLLRSVEAVLEDLGTFIHNAWANEQLAGKDLRRTLGFYNHIRDRVSEWKMPELEAEVAIAQSVILDEGVEDRTGSLAVIDAAIEAFGKRPALIRQKAKVLRNMGQSEDAALLLIEIEDALAELPRFDQGLAFRDGAAAAFNAKRYSDALRLFGKAKAVFATRDQSEALCVGLTVDEAIVLWELGLRANAIRAAGDALEAVEALDPSASRQNLRAHRMARAITGLFAYLVEPYPKGERPPVTAGLGSVLEGSEETESEELSALADNWRILETVETDVGVDANIAPRSKKRQTPSRVVAFESSLANAHFAKALEAGDFDEAVRTIGPAVSLAKSFKEAPSRSPDGKPIISRADVNSLAPSSIAELISAGWLDAIQGSLADIMLRSALVGTWTLEAENRLTGAVSAHWQSDELLQPLLKAARREVIVDGTTTLPLLTAYSIMGDEKTLSPGSRISRDLYWLYQAANSLGRRALEPVVVKAVADGWRHVVDQQSFALSMPMRTAPAIKAGIESLERRGLRGAPLLIEAASDGAGLAVPTQWRTFLDALKGNKPS